MIAHEIFEYGNEGHQIVVFDQFALSPEIWTDEAAMLSYRRIGEHYPGVRAEVHPRMMARPLVDVMAVARTVFGVALEPDTVETCFSIVTTPPPKLTAAQRLPHFDSADSNRLALLHYLSPIEEGGTAFFRHRRSGFESILPERLTAYAASLGGDMEAHGTPDAAYISGSTPQFEQIAYVEARFNRAILYRGNTLHCAHIPVGMSLPADPITGRLTVNTFIQAKPLA